MALRDIDQKKLIEGTDSWNVMRWRRQNGDDVQRGDITGWSLKVWNIEDSELVYTKAVTGNADVAGEWLWFDGLQAGDGYWDELSDKGYNNRHFLTETLVGAGVMVGGSKYQIEYILDCTLGSLGKMKKFFIWDMDSGRA